MKLQLQSNSEQSSKLIWENEIVYFLFGWTEADIVCMETDTLWFVA